ncbi:hypothetical protein BN1708_018236 [Verticillium longisporum]|uniref:Uncharacterized protein n=1 Tax=Verticillium longisporum TaxID=100787 RepID=A0A0G4LXT1_VERLO|nr:hypothetical protein BN1708_018236 [Verticillium longisporum]
MASARRSVLPASSLSITRSRHRHSPRVETMSSPSAAFRTRPAAATIWRTRSRSPSGDSDPEQLSAWPRRSKRSWLSRMPR